MRSLLGHETTQGCTLELTGNAAWAPVAAHHAVAAVDLASVEDDWSSAVGVKLDGI